MLKQRNYFLFILSLLFVVEGFTQNTQPLKTTVTGEVKKSKTIKKKKAGTSAAGLTSDGLIKAAKVAAFKQNNYPKAKTYLFKALKRSPNYADVKLFLGRIYGWTNQYDSAKYYFESVLSKKPKYEDAWAGYVDLNYFANHYEEALANVNKGLKYLPKSKLLISKKKKIEAAIKKVKSVNVASTSKLKVSNGGIDSLSEPGNQPVPKLPGNAGNQPAEKIQLEYTNQPPVNKPAVQQPSTLSNSPANLDTASADDLIILARKAVFDEKNYEKGKAYLYRALRISPTYADVMIFLGRIHTWTNNYDSAKYYFESALKAKGDYEDAFIAYSDLEYWNDHYHLSLGLDETGLRFHPQSEDLIIRKIKNLIALKDYKNAELTVNEFLLTNKKNAAALALREQIRVLSAKNSFSVGYDFSYFNKQFANPWHLVGVEYGRVTDLGKVIARVNLANRFSTNGAQFEIDAYPHISKTFYAYMNVGVPLTNVGIFPLFRAGFSLYANLPAAFEAELGFRYLQFSGNPIIIYTAYLGKYVKNWLFSERLYMVPSDYSKTISASFSLAASYYIGGTSSDDVVGGTIGYGISPDDRANNIQLNTPERLGSYKMGLFYKRKISKFDVFSISQGLAVTEYLPGTHGNEFQFGIGVTHRF